MKAPAVLIVDDDELFCESLVDYFSGLGVSTTYVHSYADALSQPLDRFTVVVVDNHLPDGEGLALIDASSREPGGPAFIMVTGDPSYDHVIAAIRHRVVDYLAKPIELEALGDAVQRALPGPATSGAARLDEPQLPETLARYAKTNLSILLMGETGTGKTRLAERIHAASPRASGPFVSINCATLADSIVEAELFGSCRGAFTGAADRPGLLVLGNGGTLFLDEIGELSLNTQAKLLSVLEEGRVRPLGGSRWRSVDVRIVAATHVDLDEAIATGRFRADLRFRLDVGRARLPPLRDQPERLGDAVRTLMSELGAPPDARLEPGELERLTRHTWPGNFRELRNVLARSLALHPCEALRPSQCINEEAMVPAEPEAPGATLAEIERRHVLQTLERHDGHRARTALALGISEVTLRRKLRTWSEHSTT
ncbi:MAG: sigma-54 dependent transcriptional regulator [Deltaproteobacteria bacterium]|nr:sigma-54 dependent transcriptional regulator [Deltaproteobacteria bacterium]